MSDIVKRLRSVYAAGPTVGSMLDPIPDPLTNEAADEIERLRQQRDEYANEITGKLMPEIEQLREALVKDDGGRMAYQNGWDNREPEIQRLRRIEAAILDAFAKRDVEIKALRDTIPPLIEDNERLRGLLQEMVKLRFYRVAGIEGLLKRASEALGDAPDQRD